MKATVWRLPPSYREPDVAKWTWEYGNGRLSGDDSPDESAATADCRRVVGADVEITTVVT
jgi:hypothetical protein